MISNSFEAFQLLKCLYSTFKIDLEPGQVEISGWKIIFIWNTKNIAALSSSFQCCFWELPYHSYNCFFVTWFSFPLWKFLGSSLYPQSFTHHCIVPWCGPFLKQFILLVAFYPETHMNVVLRPSLRLSLQLGQFSQLLSTVLGLFCEKEPSGR